MPRISMKKFMLPCLLALLALGGNVDASRIRMIVEVDGVQFVTYDNSGILPSTPPGNPPVVVPPVVTPPVVTPPGTPALPAGAMRVQWSQAGQMTAVPGAIAVHVAIPGEAVGRIRVFLLLGTGTSVVPSGTLYNGVDPKTVDGGGTAEWNVRLGGPAGPGESQGQPGQDFILNVSQPGGQECWFQFQWDPGYPPTAG